LTTTKESNSQNHWYGWVVEFNDFLTTDKHAKSLETTREFYNTAKAMDIFGKVDYSSTDINQETKKTATPF
jgi:hypothetical protein